VKDPYFEIASINAYEIIVGEMNEDEMPVESSQFYKTFYRRKLQILQ
jgi:hypothetical protein